MKIVAVDNEPRALHMLEILLGQVNGSHEIITFSDPIEALTYLQRTPVDMAFLDVDMPKMTGLNIADHLLELDDPPAVVFVTGFDEYAYQAWDVEAIDYILKPYSAQQLARAIERYEKRYLPLRKSRSSEHDVHIQCFPDFDVFVDDKPIDFRHKKSKELLAFMVHNRGAWVSVDKVIFALFESDDEETSKNYYRGILYRLRQILIAAGIPDLIETAYGKCRVDTRKFSCDYYRYLEGAREGFSGEYMSEYTWAEATSAILQRK